MPRSVEGIVAAHVAATDLRNAGKPTWAEKISSKRDDDASFEQNRDWFVAALEASKWFKVAEQGDPIHELWDEIKDAEDVEQFDYCLDLIYDLADEDRIWISFDRSLS